jgi:two-component system response regulator FixJ
MSARDIVHIIDDDAAVRDSLAFLLGTADIASRVHNSAIDFLSSFDADNTGCIITDMRMPEMDGLELLRQLQERSNVAPVIVITGHGDVSLAVQAMKAGAADFIEKPFDQGVVLSSVQTALKRRQDEGGRIDERKDIERRFHELSNRERQVLNCLLSGMPNKNIASDLGISARTVEVYRANVMTKMNANSFAELVRMAVSADLLYRTAVGS